MKVLGIHLLAEFYHCDRTVLNDLQSLSKVMGDAAKIAGATILKTAFYRFSPQGVSGVILISESHLTVHTWPEYNYAAVDIFTCGKKVNPWRSIEHIKTELKSEKIKIRDLQRGIFDEEE